MKYLGMKRRRVSLREIEIMGGRGDDGLGWLKYYI